jgi:hypothetical protein
MTQQAFERGEWQTVIDGHPLESHDPGEWLRYGVSLLQTLTPGAEAGKQQQQAALAFVQAQREGASAEEVAAAQQQALFLNLQQVLAAAGLEGIAGIAKPHSTQTAAALSAVAQVATQTGPRVTLTAISGRLDRLPAVLDSLRAQTLVPARVHLHLSREPHLLDQGVNPNHPVLVALESDPLVQIHWVPNLGSYRKIVPFLEAGGYENGSDDHIGSATGSDADDLFITVDDDTLYPPRFIEYLLHHHERHGCIVAQRGRRMRLEANGGFMPYKSWHDGLREPRLANLATGQSGVLYRRSHFPKDLELEAALALAPTHDDLWLRWLTAREGIKAVILQPNAVAKTNELAFPSASDKPVQEQPSLWFAYNAPEAPEGAIHGNDAASEAIHCYFRARGFNLEALLRQEQEEQADFY